MPFNPTDELEMRFTVTEWNAIIAQLQEGPYKLTAPLINKINLQAAKHEQQAQNPETQVAGDITYTNGEIQPPPPELTPPTRGKGAIKGGNA